MGKERMQRVNRVVRDALAEIVAESVHNPELKGVDVLSISDVQTSPDLRHARVFVTATGEPEACENAIVALKQSARHFRTELGRRVKLRYTPELKFIADGLQQSAARVEEILQEIRRERAND